MTNLQKIQTRLSESREKANALSLKTDRTKEEEVTLTELRTKHSAIEKEYRTALETSTQPKVIVQDSEKRELDNLTAKASIGSVISCALDQRATDGETRELQQHYGLSGNQIAIEQLRRPEQRAVTPGT